MTYFNGFFCFARISSSLILVTKQSSLLKTHVIPVRTYLSNFFKKPDKFGGELKDDTKMHPLTGIDDPRFTDNFKKAIFNPNLKQSFKNLGEEFVKLYEEAKVSYNSASNFRIDSKKGRIDILYTFETEEDLEKFIVHTDSSYLLGYSSASLKLNQTGTALFSGNICNDIPKDGNVKMAGYANFSTKKVMKAFFREQRHDLSPYTHLVFKIRGDGRTYSVILSTYTGYEETKYFAYMHPLYTRGGPYWQIAKMPLSHFFRTDKGMVQLRQNRRKDFRFINMIGITVAGFEGSFQLEIDYIGLEFVENHKTICPYESYKM